MKEKGLACSQKGEIAITTTNYSLQSYGEKQGGTCSIFQAIYISLQYNRDFWKSHTNLTHPGKYFRPSKVKIMRPTSPK